MELHEVPLAEAAMRLRMSGERTRRMMLRGRLEGRMEQGKWVVTVRSIERAAQSTAGPDDAA